jgi:hypothetical protein
MKNIFVRILVFLGLIVVAVCFDHLFYGLFHRKRRYLLKNGIAVVAKIISIKKTNVMVGQRTFARPRMEIVLQIEATGIPNREITITQVFGTSESVPEAGDKVNALVDPRNAENVMLLPAQSVIN